MSKIKIEYKGSKRSEITLPPELINYMVNKPVYNGRYIRFCTAVRWGSNIGEATSCFIVISNYYYDRNHNSNNYVRAYHASKTRAGLKRSNVVPTFSEVISAKVDKPNNRKGICNKYLLDYKIYEDGDYYSIVAYFTVKDILEIPKNNTDGFYNRINNVFSNYGLAKFYASMAQGNNSDEFYHFLAVNDDNSVVYVTKEKFMSIIMNKNISSSSVRDMDIFEGNTRTISLSRLCMRLYPDHNPKALQAHLEYTKMLSNYDESLFTVVTGDDIVKYYHYSNYFKNSGDLGSSCMRNDSNVKSIEFYAKNSNVSLIVMKPKDVDSIMARALLWTTTDGTKVMDRIYTCDSRLVSLFHKYAEQNNFVNIYTIREYCGDKKNLMSMSPSYWTNNYSINYIVDLDYLPEEFERIQTFYKFNAAYNNRRTSTSDSWKFPYMDNFNLINSATKQASVMGIRDTFKCELTDTFVNEDNVMEYDYHIYNNKLVKLGSDGPTLIKEDVITLDTPNTTVDIPSEIPIGDDGDIDDDNWNEEEDLDWDGLENIITQQINNV